MAKVAFLLFVGLFFRSSAQPVATKVLVSLYAESLCPDCIHFTQEPLTEAFEKVTLLFAIQ